MIIAGILLKLGYYQREYCLYEIDMVILGIYYHIYEGIIMTHVVIVGGGPVGLWTALQIKKRQPDWEIQIYERYEKYQRSHVLRLDHWSLLLYGKNSNDLREQQFYKEITGKQLSKIVIQAANSLYIKTNDLESALKNYALDKGIKIQYGLIDKVEELMNNHPECQHFIAADGAHSKIRKDLLGEHDIKDYPLQYIVEVKYQVQGKAQKQSSLKSNQVLNNMAFEYVGKEKNGVSPVTLRFFINKEDYESIPEASFKHPLSIDSDMLPLNLKQDINQYLSMRFENFGENYCSNSGKLTKLILSLYCAPEFAIKKEDWFLVGDAAMGVPYFRALNSGLMLGSRLGQILSSDTWPVNSIDRKIKVYNIHRPMHIATEFSIAKGKNLGLDLYNKVRKFGIMNNNELQTNYFSENSSSCLDDSSIPEKKKIIKLKK
jgi:hypothetical protein